jgi:hypothetical protein
MYLLALRYSTYHNIVKIIITELRKTYILSYTNFNIEKTGDFGFL